MALAGLEFSLCVDQASNSQTSAASASGVLGIKDKGVHHHSQLVYFYTVCIVCFPSQAKVHPTPFW